MTDRRGCVTIGARSSYWETDGSCRIDFEFISYEEICMSKMMILGVKGEAGLWLVDFAAGTVTAMDGSREDYLDSAEGTGETDSLVSCADVAVAFEPKEAAFSAHYYKTPQVDVAVAFEPLEAGFSGQFYKTPQVGVDAR